MAAAGDWSLNKAMSFDEAVKIEGRHAAHCMVYALSNKKVLYEGRYDEKVSLIGVNQTLLLDYDQEYETNSGT
jgi:hypothetical protein